MDGVASLAAPGLAGGGPMSGSNPHDRMVMGLLRSVADAVIVGAGTRSVPNHLWTAEHSLPAAIQLVCGTADHIREEGLPVERHRHRAG